MNRLRVKNVGRWNLACLFTIQKLNFFLRKKDICSIKYECNYSGVSVLIGDVRYWLRAIRKVVRKMCIERKGRHVER